MMIANQTRTCQMPRVFIVKPPLHGWPFGRTIFDDPTLPEALGLTRRGSRPGDRGFPPGGPCDPVGRAHPFLPRGFSSSPADCSAPVRWQSEREDAHKAAEAVSRRQSAIVKCP